MLELDERGGEEEWRRTAGEVEATACCCLESMIFIGHSDGSVTVRWEDEVADSGEKGHLWSTLLVESRKDGGDGDNDDGDGGVARMYATRPMHVSRERSPVVLTVMASSGLIDLYRVSTPLSSSGVPPSAVLLRRLSVASDNGGTSQSPTGVVDTAYDTRTRTLFAATSSSLFAIRRLWRRSKSIARCGMTSAKLDRSPKTMTGRSAGVGSHLKKWRVTNLTPFR